MTGPGPGKTVRRLLNVAWKFGFVGVASVAVYFLVLFTLRPMIGGTVALTAISYVASAVFNFAMQSTFTFRTRATNAASAGRYVVAHGVCMAANSLMMLLAVDGVGIPLFPAQLATSAVVAGLSFLLAYSWVYQRPPPQQ